MLALCGTSTTSQSLSANRAKGTPRSHKTLVKSKASPDVRPVAEGSALANAGLAWERRLPLGRLVIRPIELAEVQAAGVVLTRAFADSAEAVVLKDVLKDVESLLVADTPPSTASSEHPPAEIFLVARLYPDDLRAVSLPPGQDSRLIGTASVSLSAEAQPVRRLPQVNLPPQDGAYVSNMAVDPRFRRQGVARALLAACEDTARGAGRREVWLHVRDADTAARALYDSQGCLAAAKDSWLDTMKHGMRARVLMRREL